MIARYQDREIQYRGLSRREVRGLREDGLDLARLPEITDAGQAEAALDRVFDLAVADAAAPALEDLTPGEAMDLFVRICRATFLSPDQAKNWDAPQANGLPEGSTTAAPADSGGSTGNGNAPA